MSSSTATIRRTNPTGYASLTPASTDWGPDRHHRRTALDPLSTGPVSAVAAAASTDERDGDERRPDDN